MSENNVDSIINIEEESAEFPLMVMFLMNIIIFAVPFYLIFLMISWYPSFMRLINLDTFFGLTESKILIDDFWIWIFSPLLMLSCIFVYIVVVVYLTHFLHLYFDKKSPPVEGTFVRKFDGKNMVDERIKYYNYRGFIIKYPLWLTIKSPFYWMANWVLRKVGLNDVSKFSYFLDTMPALNFYTLKEDVYCYPTSGASSHMIDSIFGNLSNFKVITRKKATMYPHSGNGPDTIVNEKNIVMPWTLLPKHWRGKEQVRVYQGIPARPDKLYQGIQSLFTKEAMKKLDTTGALTGSELDEILSEKQFNVQNNKKKLKIKENQDSIMENDRKKVDKIVSKKKERLDPRLLMRYKIPITTSNVFHDKTSLLMLFQYVIGFYSMILTIKPYFDDIIGGKYWVLLLLPFSIHLYLFQFTFVVATIAMIMLKILRKIHPPQEGIFPLDGDEYRHYTYRYWSSYLPIWLARAIPLPWVDMAVYKMLGMKMGKSICIYDSWFDIDFVELGDHVMTSLSTSIISHAIFHNKFIQLKTVLKKNSIAGAISTIAPGTILDEGTILASTCSTYIGQHLKGIQNHIGNPVFMTTPIKDLLSEDLQKYAKGLKIKVDPTKNEVKSNKNPKKSSKKKKEDNS